MYNLLIAGGAALVAYAVGALAVSWVAGFVPALLVFVGAWFFLARRTGRQVEVIAKAAMAHMQEGRLPAARDHSHGTLHPRGRCGPRRPPRARLPKGELLGGVARRRGRAAAFAAARQRTMRKGIHRAEVSAQGVGKEREEEYGGVGRRG